MIDPTKLTDEEREAYELGVKLGAIEKEILDMDLEGLNAKINIWETVQPMLDPTDFIQNSAMISRMHQIVRILLKAKYELQQLPPASDPPIWT